MTEESRRNAKRRKPISEDWLQVTRYTAAEPTGWYLTAMQLREAAGLLWDAGNEGRVPSVAPPKLMNSWKAEGFVPPKTGGSIGVQQACFMLMGFALENLTKGTLVCRNPKLVTRAQIKKWHGDGHDLEDLFARCGIALSEAERAVLTRTTRLTVWKGRYPVPMSFYEIQPGRDMLLGQVAVGESWPEDEFNALQSLYAKADNELRKTMEATPPLPADYDFGEGK